jgi:hypothetical protein
MVLPLAPSFLRAFPRSGIAKLAVNVCSLDTNKNTNKTDGCRGRFRELLLVFSNAPTKCP